MSKIGLIAFAAAIALAGVSYADEKITFTCSGTMSIRPNAAKSPVNTSLRLNDFVSNVIAREQRPYLRAIGAPVILVQSHPLAATCRLDRGRSKMAEGNGNHHSNCIRALVEYKS